jgi:GNAT superfamily N-acetyltransferase
VPDETVASSEIKTVRNSIEIAVHARIGTFCSRWLCGIGFADMPTVCLCENPQVTLEQQKVLRQMQRTASELWAPGRRWTPGEIAWSILTSSEELDVMLLDEGWAWRQDDCVSILATNQKTARAAIEWAASSQIEVPDSDLLLAKEVRRAGYTEVENAPFNVEVRAPVAEFPTPKVADGYIFRSSQASDDLLGVHQSSWRPSELTFADAYRPSFSENEASPLTKSMLNAVEANDFYRRELHVVVEAPDSTLAASCIVWLDARTGVSSIEPLGVVPEHRRIGLAGALSQYAVRAARHLGGHEVIIHPRGDVAYPAPRGAYLRAGFETEGRTRAFTKN